jgi:hypothetical protein
VPPLTTPFLWIIICISWKKFQKRLPGYLDIEHEKWYFEMRKCLCMIDQKDNLVLFLDVQAPTGGSGITHGPLLSGVTAGIQQFTPLSF